MQRTGRQPTTNDLVKHLPPPYSISMNVTPSKIAHLNFQILATCGNARAGVLHTAHGPLDTPAFMPVGTAGTVKAMTADAVRATGCQCILGNTYHLMLRPGADRIAGMGGLHRFMDWPGPILTDSGGFQIMSLFDLRAIDADGVTFQSHIDGSRHRLTPAICMDLQDKFDFDYQYGIGRVHRFPGHPCRSYVFNGHVNALGRVVEAGISSAARDTALSASSKGALTRICACGRSTL